MFDWKGRLGHSVRPLTQDKGPGDDRRRNSLDSVGVTHGKEVDV